jgi:hypothetical protein
MICKNGLIKVEFVRSSDNHHADLATKNVTGEIHDAHLEVITGNREDIIWGMSDRIGVGEVSSSPD